MQPVRRRLHALRARWERDAQILAKYGHEAEALVLERCRANLPWQQWLEALWSTLTPRPLLEGMASTAREWEDEASLLHKYGHPEQAAMLEEAAEKLRETARDVRAQLGPEQAPSPLPE